MDSRTAVRSTAGFVRRANLGSQAVIVSGPLAYAAMSPGIKPEDETSSRRHIQSTGKSATLRAMKANFISLLSRSTRPHRVKNRFLA